MPRLFTGLEIPSAVAAHLSMVRASLPGCRWIAAEHYHVTLRFFGDIDDRTAHEIAERLGEVAVPAFELAIAGVGCFGGDRPHTLWAGVRAGPELAELQRAHEGIARAAGLPPEGRKFAPHLTLARLRGTRPTAVAEFLRYFSDLQTAPFAVRRAVLFSSRPGVGGGPYVVEAAYPLTGSATADDEETGSEPWNQAEED